MDAFWSAMELVSGMKWALERTVSPLLGSNRINEDLQMTLQRYISEIAVHNVMNCVCGALLQVPFVEEHHPITISHKFAQQCE